MSAKFKPSIQPHTLSELRCELPETLRILWQAQSQTGSVHLTISPEMALVLAADIEFAIRWREVKLL